MRTYNGKDYFYQWDLDQKVTSNGLRVGDEVHFCNMTCVKALITVGYELNGVVVADVPNILLQTSYPVVIYTMDDNGGLITKTEYQFAVKQRPQPSDYVYTETEVKRYADLENKVKELENKIENGDFNGGQIDSEVIAQEVEKYLDENPPAQGSPGKDGKDGEDGEPGRDGVDGKDGKDGKSAYAYAQEAGYTGTEAEFAQDLVADNIPAPATAQVGQTIVVKEVDGNGKPVSWECVDLAGGDKWELIESGEITDADTVFVEFTGLDKYSEITYGAMHIRDANGKSSGLKLYVNGVHIKTGGNYFIVYNQETYPTIDIRKIGKNHIHVTGCGSNLNGPHNVNPYFDFSCPIPRLATTIQSVKFEIEVKDVYFTPGSTYELWGRV